MLASAPSSARRFLPVLLMFIVLVGTLLRARDLSAPFGHGFRSVNGAFYFGQFERQYRDVGFLATRGAMVLQSWPGTTSGLVLDLNHPPGTAWLFHAAVLAAGGISELALRIVPFLAAVGGLALGAWFAARQIGIAAALAVGAVAATAPMGAYWGVQCAAQSLQLLGFTAFGIALIRYLEGRGGLLGLGLLYFGLCALDWPFYFLGPAAVVVTWLEPRWRARRWAIFGLAAVAFAAFGAYVAHAALLAGGIDPLRIAIADAARTAGHASFSMGDWFRIHASYLWEGYGLLGPLGLLALLVGARRRSSVFWVATVATLTSALDVAVFRRHAYDHPFWTIGALGGLSLAVGDAVAVGVRSGTTWTLVVATTVLLTAGLGLETTSRLQDQERTRTYVQRGAEIAAFTGPEDVIVTSAPLRQELFYIPGHVFPWIMDRALLDQVLAAYQAAGCRARIVVAIPEAELSLPDRAAMAEFARHMGSREESHGPYRAFFWDPPR